MPKLSNRCLLISLEEDHQVDVGHDKHEYHSISVDSFYAPIGFEKEQSNEFECPIVEDDKEVVEEARRNSFLGDLCDRIENAEKQYLNQLDFNQQNDFEDPSNIYSNCNNQSVKDHNVDNGEIENNSDRNTFIFEKVINPEVESKNDLLELQKLNVKVEELDEDEIVEMIENNNLYKNRKHGFSKFKMSDLKNKCEAFLIFECSGFEQIKFYEFGATFRDFLEKQKYFVSFQSIFLTLLHLCNEQKLILKEDDKSELIIVKKTHE